MPVLHRTESDTAARRAFGLVAFYPGNRVEELCGNVQSRKMIVRYRTRLIVLLKHVILTKKGILHSIPSFRSFGEAELGYYAKSPLRYFK